MKIEFYSLSTYTRYLLILDSLSRSKIPNIGFNFGTMQSKIQLEMPKLYLCIDDSGSTSSSIKYWNTVEKTLEQGIKDYGLENIDFIVWNHDASKETYDVVVKYIKRRGGTSGGTSPVCFADESWLPEESNITIVTDGQISVRDVEACDRILSGRKFKSVTVIFEGTGGNMNLSVSAPFTRNCDKVVIIVEGRLLSHGLSTSTPIDLSPYLNNPALFIADVDKINSKIVFQNIGSNVANIDLRNKLFDLKSNLLGFIANTQSNSQEIDVLREKLVESQFESALVLIRHMIAAGDATLGRKLELIFEELAKQCLGIIV